ncbi:MAG: hypothetical protein JXB49_04380 [Bacteroidales bacterium]|nr:hypothetical protein [Bacteroidales bacterium]
MIVLQPINSAFGANDFALRNNYTFIPEESGIYRYYFDGYSVYDETYFFVEGQFGLYANSISNKAHFTDSNALIIKTDNYSSTPFSDIFNLFNLQPISISGSSVNFTGNTADSTESEIYLNLNFVDDLVYLIGTIKPAYPDIAGYYAEFTGVAKTKYGGGIGTFEYPYLIYTAKHMNEIGEHPEDWASYFKMTADINLSEFKNNFNIIGYYKDENNKKPFTGVFNGENNKITDFTYLTTGKDRIGLFGYINGESAQINDLSIVDPNISSSGGKYVGALVGHLEKGDITNCHVSGGNVSGSDTVGGLIGWNNVMLNITEIDEQWCEIGKITKCSSDTNVTGNRQIGGLIGLNDGIITDCNSTEFANVDGITEIGGLVGSNKGIIIDCNLIANANITGANKVGGMAGINNDTGVIINCLASGYPNVIGTTEIGGFVGLNKGGISDCNTTGEADVTGLTKIGGFAGINDGIITDCNTIADANVMGQTEIGGFAGFNSGWIKYCNSTSIVTGENQIGGMIGYNCSILRSCSSVCTVSGKKRVGALVGRNNGNIVDSSAQGSVLGLEYVGGITGINDGGYVKNCSSMCDIDGEQYIGGFTGTNSGSLINCYSAGDISGDFYVSGGAGRNYFQIINCISEANIEVLYGYAGGLAGRNESNGLIENSYSAGNISGRFNIGGLLGFNDGVVFKCYSTGSLTDNYAADQVSDGFGGLIGDSTEQACTILSVWDVQKSNQTISAGGIGKTTAEMKNKVTFADWGKSTIDDTGDEVVYWTIYQQGSKDYPRLSWENIEGDVISTVLITDLLSGSGKVNDPFLIDSPDKLNSIGLFPHEWDKHFKLTTNINMSAYTGKKFNLIGYYRIPFAGVFDGNNRVISNFSFDSGDQSYVGLFGCVGSYLAQVKNVGMANVTINAKDNIGALAGYHKEGTIQNCYAENVNITGRDSVAGLVGYNHETISDSHSTGDVTGKSNVGGLVGNNYEGTINQCNSNSIVTGDSAVGGLAGNSSGSIKASTSTSNLFANTLAGGIAGYNTGTIENTNSTGYIRSNERVGGLIGSNEGKTTNSYSNAVIYGDLNIGGLIGFNSNAEVLDCYAVGNVDGRLNTGGFIGYNSGTASITNCYSNNSVNGSESIGGFIGVNEGAISKCFSLGIVSGTTDVGGLVGWNWESASISNSYSRNMVFSNQWAGGLAGINNGTITKCYSSGNVAGKDSTVGGLVAINYGSSSDSFWDTETSGQIDSATGTGKTTVNMKKKATYTSAGWDFNNTWKITENQDYPKLSWE